MAAFLHRNMVPCHPTSSLCFSTGRCGGAVIHPATFPFQGNASLRLWQVHSLKKQLLRKTQPPAICLCGPVSPAPGISSPSPEIGGGGGPMVELGTAGSGLGWLAAGTGLGFKPWWWPWLVLAMAVLPWGLQCLIRAGEWALTCMAWG